VPTQRNVPRVNGRCSASNDVRWTGEASCSTAPCPWRRLARWEAFDTIQASAQQALAICPRAEAAFNTWQEAAQERRPEASTASRCSKEAAAASCSSGEVSGWGSETASTSGRRGAITTGSKAGSASFTGSSEALSAVHSQSGVAGWRCPACASAAFSTFAQAAKLGLKPMPGHLAGFKKLDRKGYFARRGLAASDPAKIQTGQAKYQAKYQFLIISAYYCSYGHSIIFTQRSYLVLG
jgi:hypothetical protein